MHRRGQSIPMEYILKWLVLIVAGILCFEPAAAQTEQPSAAKYWIFFGDRGEQETSVRYDVTREALVRRARRGSGAPSSVDYHVSRAYIAALHDLGIQPVVESRWMNAVSAFLTAEQERAVTELEFVDHLRLVGGGSPSRVLETASGQHDVMPSRLKLAHSAAANAFPTLSHAGPLALDYGLSETQLAVVNAIPPLEAGINGAGVRLGFLDASFLGLQHQALQHLHLSGRAETKDFTRRAQSDSHGLSVVSVAAGYAPGELIGPAYGARIFGAITEYAPTETNAEEDYFVAGLEWLEAMGADVVSASIGYTTFDLGQRDYTANDLDGDTGITTRAADRAASLGITFVAAAGNQGCSSPSRCWYYVGTPADGDSVIAVGGINRDSTRYSGSSYGPTADGRIKPDVAAMATQVRVAVPGDEYKSSGGTSFAAPMVAGIVAQMLQVNPSLTPMEVLDILRQTASQAENPDSSLGWGIVNAAAAIQIAVDLNSDEFPSSPELQVQAYPNPATDYLFIHINARGIERPRVHLYDVLGRSVESRAADVRHPSRNLISLDITGLSAGVYVYIVEADGTRSSGTVVVVR